MGFDNNKKTVKFSYVLLFTALIIFLISLLVCIVVTIYFVIVSNNGKEEQVNHEVYRYFRTDNEGKNPSVGFSSLLTEVSNEGTFNEEEDTLTLTSNFGSTEYKCTGKCYCNEERRIASTHTASRTLFYLVAAVSSLVAYSKAQDYFEESCREKMRDSCSATVESEIEDCEPANLVENTEAEESTENHEEVEEIKYMCQGRCVRSEVKYEFPSRGGEDDVNRKHPKLRQTFKMAVKTFEKKEKCLRFHHTTYVTNREAQLEEAWSSKEVVEYRAKNPDVAKEEGFKDSVYLEMVRVYFITRKLDPYCSENSFVEFSTKSSKTPLKLSMCRGYAKRDGQAPSSELNKNAKCVKVPDDWEN